MDCAHNIGTLIVTDTFGAPYYKNSIIYPKTLF